ncbi:MAG TPA: squalene/phytoene synthase family protein [Bacteroidia bacterium]|nr:squalene/phytoene synthase family protein [Bacteroidia bacterium]
MKKLFDDLSERFSEITTKTYSTSFSLGIKMLDRKFHKPIYNIYGFVRFADEIVDSFQGYNRKELIEKFRTDTLSAIKQKISLNPILNSFQHTVYAYDIEWELIDSFLKSMEMDLEQQKYSEELYNQYIFGSAEVVGLMCLRVFSEKNKDLYDELKPYAQRLGAAFQKVNFLRDINADYKILGRTYFPGVDFEHFSDINKEQIEKDIENDFNEALVGIKKLPIGSRRGVYLAYYYYKKLHKKIKNTGHKDIATTRIRIPDMDKFGLMFKSLLRHQFNYL